MTDPVRYVLLQGLFMTLSGYLEDFIGVRFTVMCGSALMTTGVYLTAISIQVLILGDCDGKKTI